MLVLRVTVPRGASDPHKGMAQAVGTTQRRGLRTDIIPRRVRTIGGDGAEAVRGLLPPIEEPL
jgi:hypothetical protein